MGKSHKKAATARSRGSQVFLGLMSGTSGDGVDVAAVRIRGRGLGMRVEFLGHLQRPFEAGLRKRLLAIMAPAATRTEEIARLHSELGEVFADAALAMMDRLGPSDWPVAIGLAGQTVCHLPGRRQVASRQLPVASGGAGTSVGRQSSRPVSPSGVFQTFGPPPTPPWQGGALRGRRHLADKTVTLQLGNAHLVAARTGVPVVADFRQSDVAVGGQGAPLVPWTDWVLCRSSRIHRAIQNIGGIGNVTFLPAGGAPADVIAFDTGPGNMVIDLLVQHVTRGRETMDRDGARAARGHVLLPVLNRWLRHPFLRLELPRTTGRETFGRPFVEAELPRLRAASRQTDDWVATATAFTAHSIAEAYRRFLPIMHGSNETGRAGPRRSDSSNQPLIDLDLVLCGGGARNGALRAMLGSALPAARVSSIDDLGIPSEAKEAVSFAILAGARVQGVASNLPQATGASRPACLGCRVDPSGKFS